MYNRQSQSSKYFLSLLLVLLLRQAIIFMACLQRFCIISVPSVYEDQLMNLQTEPKENITYHNSRMAQQLGQSLFKLPIFEVTALRILIRHDDFLRSQPTMICSCFICISGNKECPQIRAECLQLTYSVFSWSFIYCMVNNFIYVHHTPF